MRNAIARLLGCATARSAVASRPPSAAASGQKFEARIEPFAALLAQRTGLPVKMSNSREEEMLTALCRENAEIRIRSAVDRRRRDRRP